jgi:hypothetical protein
MYGLWAPSQPLPATARLPWGPVCEQLEIVLDPHAVAALTQFLEALPAAGPGEGRSPTQTATMGADRQDSDGGSDSLSASTSSVGSLAASYA